MKRFTPVSSEQKPAFDGNNDPYPEAEAAAARIWELVQHAIENGDEDQISDEAARQLMTAAVKLYARKADGGERTFRPVLGTYDEIVTPTEALTATTEVMRALRLGPMEFGLWSRRRPEDYHLTTDEPGPAHEQPAKEPSK